MVRLIRTCGGKMNGDSLGASIGILQLYKMPTEKKPRKKAKKRTGKYSGKMIPLKGLK